MAQIVDDNLSRYVRAGNVVDLEEVSLDDLRNHVMSLANDTALHLAASEGQLDCFKVICRKCPALLHRLDGDGYTPLHVAVNSRQYEIVKMLTTTELLEKEDDKECERKDKNVPNKRLLRMLSKKGETALLRAVYLEYIEMVKLLSEADPEFQHPGDWSKKTPLEQSLTTGSSTILHQLLTACPASAFGGMVTLAKGARRVLKREALDYFKRIDCLKVIYRRYPSLAYYQYKWGETTFHRAARRGQTEIIRCLIYTSSKPPYHDKEETDYSKPEEDEEEKPDEKLLRMVNKDKDTALHLAVKEKQFDVVKIITETTPGKKLVCMVNEELDTPLHLAVRNDHLEISKLLIQAYPHKELLRIVDLNKNNALHLAIGTQNLELVKLLTRGDLDSELLTIGDKNMNAALHLAVQKRDIELVMYFLASSNSDRKLLTLVNEDKDTALHLAVHSGVFQVVKNLVAADRDNELVGMIDKNSYTALHLAVESQHIEMVKFLSEGDYGKELVRMGDKYKNTALHLAVKRHNASIVKLLLADPEHNKKLVRMVNEEKETALHLAVRSKLVEVVKLLVEAEPDKEFLRMVNKKKNTALHLAIKYQHIELVKVLTEADNDKELARMGDMNHNTALHLAIKGNDLEVVEYFLTKRMDTKILRLVTMERDSALHLAVHNHSFELVKLLISADPKKELVRMADKNKNTALHLAVGYEHLEMVKVLIAADTDDRELVKMGDKEKNTALHLAVKINNHEIVECLTQIADPVNKLVRMVNKDKDTALHLAVQDSLADIVQLLTSADREYEYSPNNAGVTPLYMAVAKGSCDIVEKILEACPFSSYSGPNGDTALRSTLVRGNSDIRKLLLEKQPNQCKEIGEHGWTSLHYATKIGDVNAVKDIIQSCPSCTKLVDNDGRNFLHLAALHKHVDIVKHALHSREISSNVLNKKDNYGYTPLHIAAETGNRNLVLPLLQNDRVNKTTVNAKGDKVLDAITFEYDKEKIGIHGVRDRMNEKELKEQRDFDLVVCALIATISFTAGITVPGGYINDGPNQGTAVLRKNIFFEVFLVTNAFSLLFSLTAAFGHFCTRRLLKKKDILFHSTLATFCTLGAIFATMVSFIVGSFAVLTASSRIAIFVCVICSSFFFFAFYAMWRMAMQYRQPAR